MKGLSCRRKGLDPFIYEGAYSLVIQIYIQITVDVALFMDEPLYIFVFILLLIPIIFSMLTLLLMSINPYSSMIDFLILNVKNHIGVGLTVRLVYLCM